MTQTCPDVNMDHGENGARMEQNRTSFPSLLRGDVSGSELPSSGELGGSPSAAAAGKRGREAREREAS